jgi:hypothetical protein
VAKTTKASGFVRKMRGATQVHLLKASDGHRYAVKFSNNPLHRRILVNELIASEIIRHLRISTPESVIIQVTEGFLRDNPDVYLELGVERKPVTPGFHFGFRYPFDVDDAAVYDFLPDALINTIVDAGDLLGKYVVDRWLANSNATQSIFFRKPCEGQGNVSRFAMECIGFGGAFDGECWRFTDSSSFAMDCRPQVYQDVDSIGSFQPWLSAIAQFLESVVEDIRERIPEEWLEGDDAGQLSTMVDELLSRRTKITDLLRASSRHIINPFPRWHWEDSDRLTSMSANLPLY